MYLVAGLGNPGEKYKNTRHNIGFLVIDEITKSLTFSNINNPNFKAIVKKSGSTIYAKPQTFMNLSGESIGSIVDYYNILDENIIIVHDDLDLAFGVVKFKKGGSHGGHNGLKSIDNHIGKEYIRVRVGIGKPESKAEVSSYVLSNFSKEQLELIYQTIIPHIIKSIDAIKTSSLENVKSTYTLKVSL